MRTYLDYTDDELIQEILKGKQELFKILVLRYEQRVAATVIGMLGRCPEAEDIGQETFVRFYQSIDRFRGESSLGTYLTRIAINLSINELKRRKRRWWLPFWGTKEKKESSPTRQIADDADVYQQSEHRELIDKALANLDEKLRSVAVLRLIEGYSTKETADLLQIPLGTVLSRLSRAQEQMKKIIQQIAK